MHLHVSTYTCIYTKGSPHTSQSSRFVPFLSLWLLLPGLSNQFYNLVVRSTPVSNTGENWLQILNALGTPV